MSREFMVALAARHERNADELIEAWGERAAIREYLAGFSRRAAETWAIGDVESMFAIGLHCPHTRQQMLSGGDRSRPRRAGAPPVPAPAVVIPPSPAIAPPPAPPVPPASPAPVQPVELDDAALRFSLLELDESPARIDAQKGSQ